MLPFINSSYFNDLLESFSNAVIIFNADGEAYAVNRAATSLFGCDATSCMGKGYAELLSGLAEPEVFGDYVNRAMQSGRAARAAAEAHAPPAPLAARYTTPDGRELHLSITTSLLKEYDKVFGVMVTVMDVTHIFRMHEREKAMLEERNRLERERTESLNHFASAVAHQVRNPLMSMAGFARVLLRKAETGSRQAELLACILEDGCRLEDLVKAVSAYTAIKAASKNAEARTATDLAGLARGCLERALDGVADVEASVSGTGEAQCESALADTALAELLTNAVEALTGEAAKDSKERRIAVEVGLDLDVDGGRARLAVTDTGPGVHPDMAPYVFDPFFTTKAVGVGMGLTKARRAARELGGDVELERTGPGGTVMVMWFPTGPSPDAPADAA